MNPLREKSLLGLIESHKLLGEIKIKNTLQKKYNNENKGTIKKQFSFEGVIVPAGWDESDNINKVCLLTQKNKDIILKHNNGPKVLKPFLNQKVKVVGDIISNDINEKTLRVRKLTRLLDGFTKPTGKISNE
jgi:hypothetical protein